MFANLVTRQISRLLIPQKQFLKQFLQLILWLIFFFVILKSVLEVYSALAAPLDLLVDTKL